jgi:hypothetical protein
MTNTVQAKMGHDKVFFISPLCAFFSFPRKGFFFFKLISYQVNYAQLIPTPRQILRKVSGVTQKIITK